jgi:hypothetical protein
MTDLMPLCLSLGAGAAAREPSPRKSVPSSFRCLGRVSVGKMFIVKFVDFWDVQLRGFSDREWSYSHWIICQCRSIPKAVSLERT